jgi:hypothetical protein
LAPEDVAIEELEIAVLRLIFFVDFLRCSFFTSPEVAACLFAPDAGLQAAQKVKARDRYSRAFWHGAEIV